MWRPAGPLEPQNPPVLNFETGIVAVSSEVPTGGFSISTCHTGYSAIPSRVCGEGQDPDFGSDLLRLTPQLSRH